MAISPVNIEGGETDMKMQLTWLGAMLDYVAVNTNA